MDHFDVIWEELIACLEPGTEIRHWNPYNGYIEEGLTIIACEPDSISIDPPRVWQSQVVPKSDFQLIWDNWGDYLALRLERRKIHALTQHSKYIISILHWHETNS